MDTVLNDSIDLVEECTSRSSESFGKRSESCECNAQKSILNGHSEAGQICQLGIDVHCRGALLRIRKPFVDRVNKIHLFIQNQFRQYILDNLVPKMIETLLSSKSDTTVSAVSMKIVEMKFDPQDFVNNMQTTLEREEIMAVDVAAATEAEAFKFAIIQVNDLFREKGVKNVRDVIILQILRWQRDLSNFLRNIDADKRLRLFENM